MAEKYYLDKDDVLKKLHIAYELARIDQKAAVSTAIADINAIPAADVQPVNQWISVDERLPENFEDCLVWYKCDTAFGKSESWGIAACSRGEWYTKHLHGDNIVVLYWQSMPKPPKDGDTE